MATRTRETERKYEAPATGGLPALDDLPGVASQSGPDELVLDAVYHDTADYRLARAGITIRRRTGGDDAGWHLKRPSGKDTREELRLPLGRAKKVPRELAELVRVHTRRRPLAPIAHLRTVRTRWFLQDAQGAVLAEVVSDQVSAQTLGESSTVDSWRELEVELVAGDTELLDGIEQRLRQTGVRRSKDVNKLSRLLGDAVRAKTVRNGLNKRSTAGQVVLAYLREQLEAMIAQDPRVRADEQDSVHRMRVASRRLRSGLQAYGNIVDRSSTRELTDELKWLAGVLGEVRDIEVLRRRISDKVHELPDDLVMGSVNERLTEHFALREAPARAALAEALDSDRYLELLDAVEELLDNPPLTPLAETRARKSLPKRVKRKKGRGGTRREAQAMAELRQIAVQAHLSGENAFTYGLVYAEMLTPSR